MTVRKSFDAQSDARSTLNNTSQSTQQGKHDDAQLDHLVSIARHLRTLSSDLEHWDAGEPKPGNPASMYASPFSSSVDDSIFQLANSYERQLVELSTTERLPWTVPLRHLQKTTPAPSFSLPPPIEDNDFSIERSLRTSMFNYDFDEQGDIIDGPRPITHEHPVFPEEVQPDGPGKLFNTQDTSYEKLLSVLTFPIDLQKTSDGLVKLHKKYIQPLLDDSLSSDNVSMIKILETERHKLIEKIDKLLMLSKGTLTDELNQIFEENGRNVSQTIAKLIDPTKKDTKSVMLSMAVHLQIYAECLIDIAHTIVNAEISNRIRMQFFKCMAREEGSQDRPECCEAVESEDDRSKSLFRDIPSFSKDGLCTFDSLVTDAEIEDFAAGIFESYDQHKESLQMSEHMFHSLEQFVERVAIKLEDDFMSIHKPGELTNRFAITANDRKARAALIESDAPLAPLMNKQTCPTCKGVSSKRNNLIGNERLSDLQDYIQSHPEKFTRAEKAVTNYYAWLLRNREAKDVDDGKQRGMWLTYKNVHDFLHGGQIGDYPVPEGPSHTEELEASAPVLRDTTECGQPALPLFVPPTVVNADARTDREPRCMSSLIENIQIARSVDIQEGFSKSIVKLLNNTKLDTKAIGLEAPASTAQQSAKKCCPYSKAEESESTPPVPADDDFSHFFYDKVKPAAVKNRGGFPETPCIAWPVLFHSVPQDRLRKLFESIAKLKPSSSLAESSAFPSHLQWVFPTPEKPMPKHVLQTLFRIGLEKIIQILEKNRLMSDSILLPKNVSEEIPFKRISAATDEKVKDASTSTFSKEKAATSTFDIMTHFSSNPCDAIETQSSALKDNFYVPPTKQHLIEQLEWNFVNILRKSSDIYKCLIFGAGAIKGHRLLSRAEGSRVNENGEVRPGDDSAPTESSEGDRSKQFPFSYANLRELYEQIYVIGLQNCLQNLRPRLLKQIYNDVRKTCEVSGGSDSAPREELSAEKQIQYIIRRIVPREEARQRMKKETKTCQCAPGDRDLQYQTEGSWILVPSPRAPVSDPKGPLIEIDNNQRGFARGGADTLTGKIRFRLRGLHILRSRTFLNILPVQGKGRADRDSGNVQFPYRFYSPTFFFAGKYWSILTMVNRIKHKNYLSLYLCCVDTVYCHFGFVLLNLRTMDRADASGDITEGDILHEGHQLFDRNNKENDYGFSNIVEIQRLFSPDAGFYDATTDSCLFDTIITVYGEKRTDEKVIKTNGIQKVKESSTHPAISTKEKVENIMDIIDGKPPQTLKSRRQNLEELSGNRDESAKGAVTKEGMRPEDLLSDQQYQLLRDKYRSFYRNYKSGYKSSGDEECPTDSEGSISSQYNIDAISAKYRGRQVSDVSHAVRSKLSEETRQKLLDDEEKEKSKEQRKETMKRIKKEKSKLQQDEKAIRNDLDEQQDAAFEQFCTQFSKKLQSVKKKEKLAKEEQRVKALAQAESTKKKLSADTFSPEKSGAAKTVKKADTQNTNKAQKKDLPAKNSEAKFSQKTEDANEWMSSSKKSSKTAPQPKAADVDLAARVKPDVPARPKPVAPKTDKPSSEVRLPAKGTAAERSGSKKPASVQQTAWAKAKPAENLVAKSEPTISVQHTQKSGLSTGWPAKQKSAAVLNAHSAAKSATMTETKTTISAEPKGKHVSQGGKGKTHTAEKSHAKSSDHRSGHGDTLERVGVTYAWKDDDDEPEDLPHARQIPYVTRDTPSHPAGPLAFDTTSVPPLQGAAPPLFSENWTMSPEAQSPRHGQSWNALFGLNTFDAQSLPQITLPKLGQNVRDEPDGQKLDWDFSSRLWKGTEDSQKNESPRANGFSFFSGLRM